MLWSFHACSSNEIVNLNHTSITILSSYRTGCYPGRLQAARYEETYASLSREFASQDLRGYVALMGNQVASECTSWKSNYLSEDNVTILDDSQEQIFEQFFDTHPSYGILHEGELVYKSEVLDADGMRASIQSIILQTSAAPLAPPPAPPLAPSPPPVLSLHPPPPLPPRSMASRRR